MAFSLLTEFNSVTPGFKLQQTPREIIWVPPSFTKSPPVVIVVQVTSYTVLVSTTGDAAVTNCDQSVSSDLKVLNWLPSYWIMPETLELSIPTWIPPEVSMVVCRY